MYVCAYIRTYSIIYTHVVLYIYIYIRMYLHMYSIYCLFTYEGMPQIYGQPLFLHHCCPAVEKLHKLSFAHTLGIPAVFSAICVWNRTAKQFLCMYVCMYIRMYLDIYT